MNESLKERVQKKRVKSRARSEHTMRRREMHALESQWQEDNEQCQGRQENAFRVWFCWLQQTDRILPRRERGKERMEV